MTFDLDITIEERLKDVNGNYVQLDFYVRHWNVWSEDSIIRILNAVPGEKHLKVSKILTSNMGVTSGSLAYLDYSNCKGYGSIRNAKLYEIK